MSEFIFRRHELKYLVSDDQRAALEEAFERTMLPDPYGESTICNVYYDTPDFRLIHASLGKPVYKEKLRLRSYGPAAPESPVFVELKKKYKSVVYKRRVTLAAREAEEALSGGSPLPGDTQIGREIDYFRRFYQTLEPAVYLCYDRTGWFSAESREVRVTFDRHIAWRQDGLRLTAPAGGQELLPPGMSLMEVKAADAIPFWLARLMGENAVRQTTFSKYGEAYKAICGQNNKRQGAILYV